MSAGYAIETSSLRKTYVSRFRGRQIQAVSDVTLRVPAGVKYGLLGPNGAGKTTFVKMLLSAVTPTSGSASLFGRDARDPEARRAVGYLPENHRFPGYLTGAGMLDFYGALSGMSPADRRERIPEMLKRVGLSGAGDLRLKKYSKGMLQRLGLAQAIIHRPKLLVLDEPTDGVDPVGRREIRDILNGLLAEGATIFINSHLLSEVESFCEYVAILKKGSLVLEGKIASLVAGHGYTIRCAAVNARAVEEMQAAGASVSPALDGIEVRSGSREEVNRMIDMIRQAGGVIEAVSRSGPSLEEVFIEATRGERAQAGRAA